MEIPEHWRETRIDEWIEKYCEERLKDLTYLTDKTFWVINDAINEEDIDWIGYGP